MNYSHDIPGYAPEDYPMYLGGETRLAEEERPVPGALNFDEPGFLEDETMSGIDPPFSSDSDSASSYQSYEPNCPYRQGALQDLSLFDARKFRLVEEFPDGQVYTGDSFGGYSYIDVDETRECGEVCYCRRHNLAPDAFAFVAHKSPSGLTIYSDQLYSELVQVVDPVALQAEEADQRNTMNGLVLLKHYPELQAHLVALESQVALDSTYSLASDMSLLVNGFLTDGEIFKSFGYENLYEQGLLSFELWRVFQQAQIERDISALDEGFCAVDEELNIAGDRAAHHTPEPPPGRETEELGFDGLETGMEAKLSLEEPLEHSNMGAPPSPQIEGELSADVLPTIEPTTGLRARFLRSNRFWPRPRTSWNSESFNLLSKAKAGDEEAVRLLLNSGADVNGGASLRVPPLIFVARAGHKEMVRPLLSNRADVEDGAYSGNTPLAVAARAGHEGVVQLLLSNGADVDSRGYVGNIPLVAAARAGHEGVVQLLLSNGADVDSGGYVRDTPLVAAARAGHKEVVQLLLSNGASVDRTGRGRETPLITAARAGHKGVVQLLLSNGADVDSGGYVSDTPLVAAAGAGHEGVVQLLLSNGADVDGGGYASDTPLVAAARAGHEGVVQQLLGNGASVGRVRRGGETPLVAAAGADHKGVIQLLLNNGADVDGNVDVDDTPLVAAARAGHEGVVQLLLSNGASTNHVGWGGESPLGAAAGADHKGVIQLLLNNRADVDGNVYVRDTPLAAAARAGHKEVVQLLLSNGADVDGEGYVGDTPLVTAAGAGHEGVVQQLLGNGASVGRVRRGGETPLVAAARAGHEGVVRLLLSSGAIVGWVGRGGETPLDAASRAGHEGVVLLLQNTAREGRILIEAAGAGCEAAVRFLLENGADANLMIQGNTPLSTAAIRGYSSIVSLLLLWGADEQLASLVLIASRHQRSIWKQRLAEKLLKAASLRSSAMLSAGYSLERLRDPVGDFRPKSRGLDAAKVRKIRYLYEKFLEQHKILVRASEKSITSFRKMAERFRDHRELWAAGIRTLRGLCHNSQPGNPGDTIAFICIAKAIGEILKTDQGECISQVDKDFSRWEMLFSSGEDLGCYREAVLSMWGVTLSGSRAGAGHLFAAEALGYFQALASTLVRQARAAGLRLPTATRQSLADCEQAKDSILHSIRASNSANAYFVTRLHDTIGTALECEIIASFAGLKRLFTESANPNWLGCTEAEAQAVREKVQDACDYYEPVYTVQESYRAVEEYIGFKVHRTIVPTSRHAAQSAPVGRSENSPMGASPGNQSRHYGGTEGETHPTLTAAADTSDDDTTLEPTPAR
ncbi:hypothetical protein FGG08_004499 [Glutinoglossum americanum]|uniref:Uncharacterized protein n=1 Tax=Glutinoglossum americanum TaxID=1670608 RepID=A0A9P8HW96_9PEZI|nr:hypothetical protein FGG08_004499 [Glutinoglossum americanum]